MINKIAELYIKTVNYARWRIIWSVKVVYFCAEKMFYNWDEVRNQSVSGGIFWTGYGETESPVSCGLEIDSGKEMDTKPVKYAFTDDVSDW